jgi:hypothetical protein
LDWMFCVIFAEAPLYDKIRQQVKLFLQKGLAQFLVKPAQAAEILRHLSLRSSLYRNVLFI